MHELATIAAIVSAHYGVAVKLLRSPARVAGVVRPRQVAMWLARCRGYTTGEIGRYWGRDHTTVLHSLKAVEARRQTRLGVIPETDALLRAVDEHADVAELWVAAVPFRTARLPVFRVAA